VFASSPAERDARSFLQMPSTRQIAAIAVLAVTTAACLWMLMRKAKEPEVIT
jgi:alkylhydroperoxidase/carboxymuconolactone decarboxylase family protein YurZ